MKTIKHKGVRIVPVKITRYEVRDPTGHKLASFNSSGGARSWINGYMAMADKAAKEVAAVAPKPRRKRVAKSVQPV